MNWLETADLETLINYRNNLQKKFDYLWETHTRALTMRKIGARLIYVNSLIKAKNIS